MDKPALKAAFNSVLVRPLYGDDRSNWGVFLASDCWEGVVVSSPPGLVIAVGERIIFHKDSSTDLFRDGSVVSVRLEDVLAFVNTTNDKLV